MAEMLTPKLKTCTNCSPLVVPRRGYTPARPSCVECVEKHLGAAYVLLAELNDLPDARRTERPNLSRRLRAIGHLFEAEDESQQWPELHAAIREARRAYQGAGEIPDFNAMALVLARHGQGVGISASVTVPSDSSTSGHSPG